MVSLVRTPIVARWSKTGVIEFMEGQVVSSIRARIIMLHSWLEYPDMIDNDRTIRV